MIHNEAGKLLSYNVACRQMSINFHYHFCIAIPCNSGQLHFAKKAIDIFVSIVKSGLAAFLVTSGVKTCYSNVMLEIRPSHN